MHDPDNLINAAVWAIVLLAAYFLSARQPACTCRGEDDCSLHVRRCEKCWRAGRLVDAIEHSDSEHDAYFGKVSR